MKRKASPAKGVDKSPSKAKTKTETAVKKVSAVTKSTLKSAVKSAVKSTVDSAKSSAKSLKATVSQVKKAVAKKSTKAPVKAPAKATAKAAPTKAPAKASAKARAEAAVKTPAKAAAKTTAKATVTGTVKKVVKGLQAALKKITPEKKTRAASKAPAKTAAVKKTAAKAAPAKTLRPKAFPARDVEKSFGFPADVPELPESYGEDRLVLMTQDPEYLYAYWEITPEQRALSESAKRAGEQYEEALRLNWTARDLFAPNFALLPVSLDARKGYLRVPYSGLSYQVEIGWVSDQGHFISILGRSNRSDAPESWKQTRTRLKQAAGERSVLQYNLSVTQPLGSSDLGRFGALAAEENLPADWGFEGPGSLSSSASSGAVVRKIPAATRKKSR